MSRHSAWLKIKEKLDELQHVPPHVSEGEIWWASIGQNVGSEIYGKDRLFTRPVIIYKKLSHSFYFVIPTTTKVQLGTWFVTFEHQKAVSVACLHQARAMDHRRLSSKIGTLDTAHFERVKEGFRRLFK